MSSIEELAKGLDEEKIELPDDLKSKLVCIENMGKPLIATKKGKQQLATEVHEFEQNKIKYGEVNKSPPTRLAVLAKIVESTNELESGKITKEQHIQNIIKYLDTYKERETMELYALRGIKNLRGSGYIEGDCSLITCTTAGIEDLLLEMIHLEDYTTFLEALRNLGYGNAEGLHNILFRDFHFSKGKISFIGRELARLTGEKYVMHVPVSLDEREPAVRIFVDDNGTTGKTFYIVRKRKVSFFDQYGGDVEETFADPNFNSELINLKSVPICRYILSTVNKKSISIPGFENIKEQSFEPNTLGALIRIAAYNLQSNEEAFSKELKIKYIDTLLNLLSTFQIKMKLEIKAESCLVHFCQFENYKGQKDIWYNSVEENVSKFLDELRESEKYYPCINFIDADEVKERWNGFSEKEKEVELRPLVYMNFLKALFEDVTDLWYKGTKDIRPKRQEIKKPSLDRIGYFSITEDGKKNLHGITPLFPYISMPLPLTSRAMYELHARGRL